MELIPVNPEPLLLRGVKKIYYVRIDEKPSVKGIRDIWVLANKVAYKIMRELEIDNYRLEFLNNENIGSSYMLYRYRIYMDNRHIASIRIVTRNNNLYQIVTTVGI